jgi:hypothetical protein
MASAPQLLLSTDVVEMRRHGRTGLYWYKRHEHVEIETVVSSLTFWNSLMVRLDGLNLPSSHILGQAHGIGRLWPAYVSVSLPCVGGRYME